MPDPAASRRPNFRSTWCCSFSRNPINPPPPPPPTLKPPKPPKPFSAASSLHSSPSPTTKLSLGIIDPRRILSPGRVSPIPHLPPNPGPLAAPPPEIPFPPPPRSPPLLKSEKGFDLRFRVNGRGGGRLVMEMDSRVLCASSSYFAGMVLRARSKVADVGDCWEIEVDGVGDLEVFRGMIEMMYERDEMGWLVKAGVERAIDVLEVSATVMFDRGTRSCLKYLEAVPWTEHEEEKLKSLFSRCTFDASVTEEVLSRLHPEGSSGSEELAVQLIRSVANGTNDNARRELQALVNGLLSKSSVYSKDLAGLNKDSLYTICGTCVNSLVELFKEASSSGAAEPGTSMTKEPRPLVERISKQVENLNWLLDILTDKQMAADFVHLWAGQDELLRLHERTSSMIRYELSRISASVFMAMGRGKVQCHVDVRHSVLRRWFRPLLLDFGWIQRCPKGFDMRMLEEGLGQAILTLPLKQQQTLFVEWFQFFGTQGSECPNLSKAFQIWWRRSFVRGVETHS